VVASAVVRIASRVGAGGQRAARSVTLGSCGLIPLNPDGVAAWGRTTQPHWGCRCTGTIEPRVAPAARPWAEGRGPFRAGLPGAPLSTPIAGNLTQPENEGWRASRG
jgi:hypothetical protein